MLEPVSSAERVTSDFEIILVNDGSPDNSLEIALSLYRKDARVRIVDLSRNFGHHKAMMTGLAHARGEMVFLLDSASKRSLSLKYILREVTRREPTLSLACNKNARVGRSSG